MSQASIFAPPGYVYKYCITNTNIALKIQIQILHLKHRNKVGLITVTVSEKCTLMMLLKQGSACKTDFMLLSEIYIRAYHMSFFLFRIANCIAEKFCVKCPFMSQQISRGQMSEV